MSGEGKVSVDLPETLEQRLSHAKPGDIVDVAPFSLDRVTTQSYEKRGGGPPMVFSDDPEYFRVPEGAGVREQVGPGGVRLYVYHVNATTDSAKRISSVIENLGSGPLTVRFRRYASTGPSTDYYKVGKQGLVEYFSGKVPSQTLVIPPGQAAPLDPRMDSAAVKFDELIHGFYDFEIDQPARITTLQTTLDTPAVEANARIKEVLPPRKGSGAGRGLYQTTEFDVSLPGGQIYDTAEGLRQIVLADGKTDPWIKGWDSSRQTSVTLAGNYGVLYHVRFEYTSSDGRALVLGLWYPPSGRQWCEACALAVVVNDGRFKGGIVPLPRTSTIFKGRSSVAVIQVYPPQPASKKGVIELTYSPPGASCLPTPLLLIPVRLGEP
ncbi:MAG: copper amine oxidase [Candidatus Sumerlaeaceae bacterium]